MKYCLIFKCNDKIRLPIQYNHILQAAILGWIQDETYTSFLHDEGFQREKRTFKLYSFSQIIGKNHIDRKSGKIVFDDKICIFISSYIDEMENYIKKSIEANRKLRFGNNELPLDEAYRVDEKYESCVVETLSPISIHSTFELPSGKKRTYYYTPSEEDFSNMIKDNLVRKYQAVHGDLPKDDTFEIIPVKGNSMEKQIIKYRGTVIIGWNGVFELKGSTDMIKMALLAGVGARNSIGLGCLLQKNPVDENGEK
ncbi:MAG: CRISPR-associated endoribonuclease Cas6 [Lachnospiraceae bacterium]|nr:CRISPR-associated endoribonuclease Cas6 [Lachnospiraceae bacterium]